MTNYGSVAKDVRAQKELYPEKYCPIRKCLWRTGDGSCCPRHAHLQAQVDAINNAARKSAGKEK